MGLIPVFVLLSGARYNYFLMTIFYDIDMGLILFSRTLPVPTIGGPLPWVPTALASLIGDIILIIMFTWLEILDKKI
ncbi:MAG: hypothetical protein JZD40_05565 [Sulfolobus sp.]|nr:hypothetical protein [Sulfolobus sp.]